MELSIAQIRAQQLASPRPAQRLAGLRRRTCRSLQAQFCGQRPESAPFRPHNAGYGPPARLRLAQLRAQAASAAAAPPLPANAPERAEMRDQRLEVLVQLRKLYRNLLRAETLLQQPSPVYQPPPPPEGTDAAAAAAAAQAAAIAQAAANGANEAVLRCGAEGCTMECEATAGGTGLNLAAAAAEEEELQRIQEAVDVVAELQLTAEELKAGIRALRAAPVRWGSVFDASAGPLEEVEARITARVREVAALLTARAAEELPSLPFGCLPAAQAALDARNAKYRMQPGWSATADWHSADEDAFGGSPLSSPEKGKGLGERLEAAERVAEAFVARKLQPAVARVRKTSPQGVVQGIKSSALWARDLWTRLNGGGAGGVSAVPAGLPLPRSSDEARRKRLTALNLEIEALEAKLQDASKARESRLRKAGIQGRARVAAELRGMDSDVAALSKALAVKTLELEMEYIFAALEDEALDIVGDSKGDKKLALNRRGSSDEVALLIAEFRLLDEQLSALSTAAASTALASGVGEAALASSSDSSATPASFNVTSSGSDLDAELVERGAAYIDEAELARLAVEVPDLRVRLGIADQQVFGGTGFSLVKLQMQAQDGVNKVVDGVLFGVRGVKLLFTDIGNAGRLFWRAVSGGTLKPREVQALRRTVRDLLTFVPFVIILIIPMTPVGHVLVFSFIQRYFPGFFPSQFTGRRQELMMKYDELKQQLQMAQMRAEAENDEIEFQRAAAAAAAVMQRKETLKLRRAEAAAAQAATAGAAATASSSTDAATAAASQPQHAASPAKGTPVDDGEEEEEGPAARAVRQIEQQLAAAADDSYCEDPAAEKPDGT